METGAAAGLMRKDRRTGWCIGRRRKGKRGVLGQASTAFSLPLPFPSALSPPGACFLPAVAISGRATCPGLSQDDWQWQGYPESKVATAQSPRWTRDEPVNELSQSALD